MDTECGAIFGMNFPCHGDATALVVQFFLPWFVMLCPLRGSLQYNNKAPGMVNKLGKTGHCAVLRDEFRMSSQKSPTGEGKSHCI